MLTCLCHREVVFHRKKDRVHVHLFFHQMHLEVRILTPGNSYRAIIPVSVHPAIFVADDLQFLPSFIPVNAFPVFIRLAGRTDSLLIESDTRPRIRHNAFFTIFHSKPSLNIKNEPAAHRDSL